MQYTITQLTDNNLNDTIPQIDAGKVVWSASDGNDPEIFFYDGNNTVQVTDNEVFDNTPQISGNNLVWQRTQEDPLLNLFGDSEVIFYDGTTETSLATVNAPTIPAIAGNNIVWGEDFLFGGRILLFDGTETTQLTESGAFIPINSNSISENSIVWTSGIDFNTGSSDIFFYDGTDTTQITNGGVNLLPVVSGNNVAWSGADVSTGQNTSDIFFYNGTETIQLTDDDVFDVAVGISGNNVVWATGDRNSQTQTDLFVYNGNETIQLTDNDPTTANVWGGISGDTIVWAESDGNDLEIFVYDGNTTTQITDNNTDDSAPDIDSNNIVWEGKDGDDTEIFLATLDSTNNNEPSPTIYRFFNNDTGVHFYTASSTERDAVQNLGNYSFEGTSYRGVDPTT